MSTAELRMASFVQGLALASSFVLAALNSGSSESSGLTRPFPRPPAPPPLPPPR